ncbi:hypothetical protein HYS94_05345 [Candidatus Daviesbacteria bacterium]|nr:hypothetical protein [Candidatus Daviesbacteria bacterium]
MICETGVEKGKIIVGRTYPGGNLKGERGEPITIAADPTIRYFNIKNGERRPIEYNPLTGGERELKIPHG